jgi:hypothetical protein
VKIMSLKFLIALAACTAAAAAHAREECDEEYGLFKAIATVRDRGVSYNAQIRKTDQLADKDGWPDTERKLWKLTIKKVYAYAPYADLTPGQIGNLERGSCELRSR